jgi:ubiquinone/menaquinone biosynthesis C-methylase UbiE
MSSALKPDTVNSQALKQCCARLYESDFAKLLLGDSFHPGGLELTERLGQLLHLSRSSRVLDVASGRGMSALFLAQRFGCHVVGLDYSTLNVEQASREAEDKGLSARICFQQGDAESLPFPDASFDAVVCECSFCTFREKSRVAFEFARVLRPGGRVGISDLTRGLSLPRELDGLLAWVACIADARRIEDYVDILVSAGLSTEITESHDEALVEMVRRARTRMLSVEIMTGLKKLDFPDLDLTVAKQTAKSALTAIQNGQLGYAIITMRKNA